MCALTVLPLPFRPERKTSHTSKFKESLKSVDLRKAGGRLKQGGRGGVGGAEGSSSSFALNGAIDSLSEWSALPNPPRCCPARIIERHPHRSAPLISFPIPLSSCDSGKVRNCHSPSVLSRDHTSRIDFCKDLSK